MRVVAGELGGRRLAAPAGRGTRPTADKVRGAVFSSLASLVDLDGAAVADLFAGSGALGIEALSRGAASAVFVEADRSALAVIRANLDALGLAARPGVVVRPGDAVAATSSDAVATADVVFADPPYAFDRWVALADGLVQGGFTGVLVAETGAALDVPDGWHALRQKAYGSTVISMLRPTAVPLP